MKGLLEHLATIGEGGAIDPEIAEPIMLLGAGVIAGMVLGSMARQLRERVEYRTALLGGLEDRVMTLRALAAGRIAGGDA